MNIDDMSVELGDLAVADIKARSKIKVADIIAGKIIEKYGKDIMQEVVKSISEEEIREKVLDRIADKAVENWRRS